MRSARVGDVWDEARACAEADGEKWSEVLERILRNYVKASNRRRKAAQGQDRTD